MYKRMEPYMVCVAWDSWISIVDSWPKKGMSTIHDTRYVELGGQWHSVLNMLMSICTAFSGLKCSVFGVVHQKQLGSPKLKKCTVQVYRGRFR